MGSPPHTWRILMLANDMHIQDRITSTYVENTKKKLIKTKNGRDHLHIRGEYDVSSLHVV